MTLAILTPSHLKEFFHAHNPLYASLNMSKLVVAVQGNVDDDSYSHAHTCTVQGRRKEFSHAPPPPDGIPGILPRAHLRLLVNTPPPSTSHLPRQTEFQEFCHVHTCTPRQIPGKLMTSAFLTLTPG